MYNDKLKYWEEQYSAFQAKFFQLCITNFSLLEQRGAMWIARCREMDSYNK
jgi:hypothetical protein